MCWYLYWRVPEKNCIEASPNKNAALNMSLCDKHVSIKQIYAHTHIIQSTVLQICVSVLDDIVFKSVYFSVVM